MHRKEHHERMHPNGATPRGMGRHMSAGSETNGGKSESDATFSTCNTNAGSSRPRGTPAEQLASVEAQQQDLARQIATLESDASRTPDTPGSSSPRRGDASITART